ncbi:acetyltransferase, GNAT family [Gottschalkia purinilytica]|uniref:Acetyltransferase, GNAT family n=1 Tax=Gottschalkia purinilytica TaxID=1503 RepID=A0A0L0W793_GOTPU|nr:GNAT family protein [Gottschalkia purinilytica]KNF07145.1 acetyltransferase, GNAT family [Gottschalkia purinilytica]
MDVIKGHRVKILPLKLEHVFKMKNWGKYQSLLFEDYNFPDLNDREVKKWFDIKTSEKTSKNFIVINENEIIIGYVAIKNIKKLNKSSTLGITFDYNYINKGYGTDTILAMLDYYFNVMKMRTMYLDVAKHNKRAIRCYEKCGFKKINEYIMEMKNPHIDINSKEIIELRDNFIVENNQIYEYYYKMKISKKLHNKNISTQIHM